MKLAALLLTFAAIGAAVAAASPARADGTATWVVRAPDQIEWRPAETLPPGAMIAVLEGDPSQPGIFTMRIKMPDGYEVPPHSHGQQERVTVLSGTLNLGHGSTFDAGATRALGPGTYSSMPPGMNHFGWMSGETILQLSSTGPWTVAYVDPADDPRSAPRSK